MSLKSDPVDEKSQALESTRPGFEYQLCSLQALLPYTSYLTSLSHVCETVRIGIPTSQVHDGIESLHIKSSVQGLHVYPGWAHSQRNRRISEKTGRNSVSGGSANAKGARERVRPNFAMENSIICFSCV